MNLKHDMMATTIRVRRSEKGISAQITVWSFFSTFGREETQSFFFRPKKP